SLGVSFAASRWVRQGNASGWTDGRIVAGELTFISLCSRRPAVGVHLMRLSALAVAALALSAPTALPADAAGLNTASAAHRAFYTLTLSNSRGGDVVAARGTMGYEVIDACDGWAVRQRLSMTLTNSDGQDVQMVSDYATWEAKDGLKFRFHMKQTTDSAVTSQTDGDAKLERTGGPGEAHYTVPQDTTKKPPAGTLFPMAHTSAILAGAQ